MALMIEFSWASQSFQWLVARSYEFTRDFLEPALKSNVLLMSITERAKLGNANSRRIYKPILQHKITAGDSYKEPMQLANDELLAMIDAPWSRSVPPEHRAVRRGHAGD